MKSITELKDNGGRRLGIRDEEILIPTTFLKDGPVMIAEAVRTEDVVFALE